MLAANYRSHNNMIFICLCYLLFAACNCMLYDIIMFFTTTVSRILSHSMVNQHAISAVLECYDCRRSYCVQLDIGNQNKITSVN